MRAYLHWSLVDNYEWGTYEPRFGLYGMDRSDPTSVRWMDTDAQGDDAAGEFARVLGGPARRRSLGPRRARLSRVMGQPAGSFSGVAASDGPSTSRFSLRRCRTKRTTTTTTMRPSRMSDAIPLAFSTRWPTK